MKELSAFKWLKNVLGQEEVNSASTSRFDFLDGYRGSLALVVVLAHASESIQDCPFLLGFGKISQKYAIAGFFLLSSFLLTYRVLKDFHKPNASILVCTLQYFIRRFFRIYILFAAFTFVAIEGPEFFAGYTYGKYEDIVEILSLGYTGLNHLWTIAPEVKFYFLIPLICLFFYALRHFAPLLVLASLVWTWYDQVYNAFSLITQDMFSYSHHAYLLRNHFSVFFIGSQVAMAFFLVEKLEWFMKWVKQDRIQLFMNFSSLLIAGYAFYFHTEISNKIIDYRYRSRPAIFWSACLLMALLSDSSKNLIVKFFTSSEFLKSCGKFSFGMYLLHPAAIQFVFGFRLIVKLKLGVILSVAFSYILGYLVYHLLEKHLIKLANYLCNKLENFTSSKVDNSQINVNLII